MYLNISLKILLSREKSYKSFFTKKKHTPPEQKEMRPVPSESWISVGLILAFKSGLILLGSSRLFFGTPEIHLYMNLACLFVCLYPINVETAEPIRPKFCVGPHVFPRKVYE